MKHNIKTLELKPYIYYATSVHCTAFEKQALQLACGTLAAKDSAGSSVYLEVKSEICLTYKIIIKYSRSLNLLIHFKPQDA